MALAKIHWNGELRALPGGGLKIPSGSPPLPEEDQSETSGPKQIQTNNASGVIVASGQKAFTENSITGVSSHITVPTVEAPSSDIVSCPAEGYVVIAAVGIDGFVFNTGDGYGYDPQLEAGLYEQLSCYNDLYYFATFAFQGVYNVAFDVNPGDVFNAAANTLGGSRSDVFLQDLITETYASYNVATSGIVGATANWTVERLCCSNNEPIALANTVSIAFGYAIAGSESEKFFYPGSQAKTTEVLTMTDDAGDQGTEIVIQGSAGNEGLRGLWFETTGCASIGGCTP
jgi:hypothetical protein